MSASTREKIPGHCDTCRCSDTGLPSNLQELDDYIDILRTRLGEARGRRNGLTVTAYRLPTEILGDIFLYSRDIADRTNVSLWLPTVSHVSSFWRAVAISWSPLWTQVDLSHSEMAAEMIRRAGGTPITLRLVAPTSRYMFLPEVYRAISSTSRIHAIDFRKTDVFAPKIGRLYNGNSKYLAGIIVRAKDHVQHMKLSFPMSPQHHIRYQVSNVTYPLLQTLHLSGCEFKEWTMPLIRHSKLLRSLTVNSSWSMEKTFQVTIDELVETLQGLQHLEDLTMINAFRDAEEGTMDRNDHPRVSLPRLSHFQITSRHAMVPITLTECLQLPSKCQISIKTHRPSSPADDVPLLRRLLSPAPHKICLRIQPYTLQMHTYARDGRHAPHHSATIAWRDMGPDSYLEALGSVFSPLPRSTELSIFSMLGSVGQLFHNASAETVRWEWGECPCGRVAGFLRDFLVNEHAFPHLTTMIFDGLDFSRKSVGDRPELELEEIAVALARIPTFRTLRLFGCANIPEELLVSWRVHLPEVVLE